MKRHPPLEELQKTLSYNPVTGYFTKHTTVGKKVRSGDRVYISVTIGGRQYQAHRLAWYLYYGREPREGYEVDHINGDKGDNRIENLRELTHSQNVKACRQANYSLFLTNQWR